MVNSKPLQPPPVGEVELGDRRRDAPFAAPADPRQAPSGRPSGDPREGRRFQPGAGTPDRRTVTISGQGAEGYASRNGTRPSGAARHQQLKRHERAGFRPDRVAMWAVLLGVLLLFAAATSSHGAILAVHHVSAFTGH